MKILDFGCGNGENAYLLSVENKNNEVIGVDLDVAVAKSKYPALKFIRLQNGSLPFADKTFDAIHASDVLEHVGGLSLAISEIARVLKNGGRLDVSIPHFKTEKMLSAANPNYLRQIGHQRIFAAGELEEILERAGFKIISRRQKGSFLFFSLWLLLNSKKNILNQRGEFEPTIAYRILMALNQFFDREMTFKTRAKFFPFWLLAWPLAGIFDRIYPKTVKLAALKK